MNHINHHDVTNQSDLRDRLGRSILLDGERGYGRGRGGHHHAAAPDERDGERWDGPQRRPSRGPRERGSHAGRLPEGLLPEGRVSEGRVSEGRVSEGRVSEGRLGEDGPRAGGPRVGIPRGGRRGWFGPAMAFGESRGRGPGGPGGFGPGGFGPGGFGPGGFGPGGFGPGGRGPRGFGPGGPGMRGGGRRGGRGGRGDVRAAVLLLLSEEPMHGYQLIQQITERSGGVWTPSPGSVYPALQQLEDEGLIAFERVSGRKTASLTEQGRAHVTEHAADLGSPWDDVSGGVSTEVRDLRELVGGLMAAVHQVASIGTPAQAGQAAQVLGDARRAMYRILAEADEPPAT